jgi:hypothetical protein
MGVARGIILNKGINVAEAPTLITAPESRQLIGDGASACASGSQACKNISGILIPNPTKIRVIESIPIQPVSGVSLFKSRVPV